MLTHRVACASAALSSVVLMLASCRPAAEANSMPVVLARSVDRWVLSVPACEGRDGIARFDLTSGSTTSGGRAVGDRDDQRAIELVVTAATMTDGSYNPDEVKVVSNLGEIGADPLVLEVFVSTAKGFAEFRIADIVDRYGTDAVVVITGRDEARVGPPDPSWIDQWCHPT
jgi:hypothetical protein